MRSYFSLKVFNLISSKVIKLNKLVDKNEVIIITWITKKVNKIQKALNLGLKILKKNVEYKKPKVM